MEEVKQIQTEFKERNQQSKNSYRRRLEHKLQQNNVRDV